MDLRGIKNALSVTPTNKLQDKDLIILTETFLMDSCQQTEFYNIHLLAKKEREYDQKEECQSPWNHGWHPT